MRVHTRQITLRVPVDVLLALDGSALHEGRSRSGQVVHLLRRSLGVLVAGVERPGAEGAAAAAAEAK